MIATLFPPPYQYAPGQSSEEWIRRADTALYQAKAAGRNRVIKADGVDAIGAVPADSGSRATG